MDDQDTTKHPSRSESPSLPPELDLDGLVASYDAIRPSNGASDEDLIGYLAGKSWSTDAREQADLIARVKAKSTLPSTSGEEIAFKSLVANYDATRPSNSASDQDLIAYLAGKLWTANPDEQADLIARVKATSSLPKAAATASASGAGSASGESEDIIRFPFAALAENPILQGLVTPYKRVKHTDPADFFEHIIHAPTKDFRGNLMETVFALVNSLGDGPKDVIFDVDNTLWAREDNGKRPFLDPRNPDGSYLVNIEWPDVLAALMLSEHNVNLVTARSGADAKKVQADLAASGIQKDIHYRAIKVTQDALKHTAVESFSSRAGTVFFDDNLGNSIPVAFHLTRLGIPVLSVNVNTMSGFKNLDDRATAELMLTFMDE